MGERRTKKSEQDKTSTMDKREHTFKNKVRDTMNEKNDKINSKLKEKLEVKI